MLIFYLFFLVLMMLLISFILIKLSPYFKLLDYPDGSRKIHKSATPLVGGCCIFSGLIISYIFYNDFGYQLLLSSFIIFFIGLLDDIKNIKYVTRLLTQIIISIYIVYSNYFNTDFNLSTHLFIKPLLVLFIIVVINSFNFIDGVDGLTLSLSLVCLISLFIITGLDSHLIMTLIISCFIALLFNMSIFGLKNKFFLGDNGSTLIGFLISIFLIKYIFLNSNIDQIYLSPILLIMIPFFDAFFVVLFVRIFSLKNPFKGDRNHIHHVLQNLNFSDKYILFILTLFSLIFSILYFLFSSGLMTSNVILLFIILYFIFYFYIHIINQKIDLSN